MQQLKKTEYDFLQLIATQLNIFIPSPLSAFDPVQQIITN